MIALAALLACFTAAADASPRDPAVPGYLYVSPVPGSRLVSPMNNIAVRPGGTIDPATVTQARFAVTGSMSGRHAGSCVLSDDARTLIFAPDRPFAPGEVVSVALEPVRGGRRGRGLPPLQFAFTVSPGGVGEPAPPLAPELARAPEVAPRAQVPEARVLPRTADLPAGLPPIILLAQSDPQSGCRFITPLTNELRAPLLIVDRFGMPIFYRQTDVNLLDFRKQGGLLTYFDQTGHRGYALDSTYAVVDSFEAGNGYVADFHDLQLLPNGHCLLLCYDTQPVAMDTVVEGGDPNAHVTGLVIQELDASKNVVFQWRSWDHFEITDAVNVDLTAFLIDYVHGNAIEPDTDGNLLLSSRHLNEITKIDRATGAIVWRMGLNAVNNEFTFIDDPRGFSHQHDVRRAPDGNLTLFDNGNFLDPEDSRAAEYEVDEVNRTATLVWEYRPVPDGFSHSSGSVQRHTDGSVTIGWGAGSVVPDVSELHPDGTKGLEFTYYPGPMTSYRAFRFPWRGALIATDKDSLEFGAVAVNDTVVKTIEVTNNGTTDLAITSFVSTDSASIKVEEPVPLVIPSGGTVEVHVDFHPASLGARQARLYVRSASDSELVAQVVDVTGSGILPVLLPLLNRSLLALLALLTAGSAALLLRRRSGSAG